MLTVKTYTNTGVSASASFVVPCKYGSACADQQQVMPKDSSTLDTAGSALILSCIFTYDTISSTTALRHLLLVASSIWCHVVPTSL